MSARTIELHHGDHLISTDRARVDVDGVHRWLTEEAYWAVGRTVETQRRTIENSALVVGAYDAVLRDGRGPVGEVVVADA